jgi:hypothetical protein
LRNVKKIDNGFEFTDGTVRAYIVNDTKICNWEDAIKNYSRFNLLGQSIEFEINGLQVNNQSNASIYLTTMKGSVKEEDNYCDIRTDPLCIELDLIEMNCNGIQTTVHSPTDVRNGKPCNVNGCYVGRAQKESICNFLNSEWIRVKTTFGNDGTMKVYFGPVENEIQIFGNDNIPNNSSAKQDIVKYMKEGMVIIASIWPGDQSWLNKCNSKCSSTSPGTPPVQYRNFKISGGLIN